MEERKTTRDMETEIKNSFKPYFLIMILIPAIVSAMEMFLIQNTITGAVRNLIVIAIIAFIMVYTLKDELGFGGVMLITLCALLSSVQAFIPDFIMPVAAFSVIIAFVVTPNAGFASIIFFSAMPFMASERSFEYFLFFIATGSIGTALMYIKSKNGRYFEALTVFSLIYLMLYTALIILKRMSLNVDIIVFPILGLILDVVIMEIAGYNYYINVVKRKEDQYTSVIDPEFPLLIRLKNNNREEYKRAIHTAHFTELFADKFGYDKVIMKGLGFYHRIGVLDEEDASLPLRTVKIATEEEFPEELIKFLKEYGEVKAEERTSAEVSICIIADTVITNLMEEYANKNDKPDMNKFVDKTILKMFSGKNSILKRSEIPYDDLEQIRKIFKEEKIYYDFLR